MNRTYKLNHVYYRYIKGLDGEPDLDLTVDQALEVLVSRGLARVIENGERYEEIENVTRDRFIKLITGEIK